MFFTYRARAASRSVRSWASSPGRGLVVDIRRRRRRMRGGLFYWLYRKFYWLFRKCYWLFRNFYWLFRNFYWLFRNFYWLYRKFYRLYRNFYWLFRNFYWLFRNFYWLFRNFYWLFRKSRPVRAASKQPRATPWGSGTHKTRPVRAKAFMTECFQPLQGGGCGRPFPQGVALG